MKEQQSECHRRICLFLIFLLSQSFGVWEKQRTLSEPGETDGEQWTDRAQSTVATCHGLTDIFQVRETFPVSWFLITTQEAYL